MFFFEEKKQKTFDINRLKLHDHTRSTALPAAHRTSNGFTREAQKKVFWFFSTEKNYLLHAHSFSGAPNGLRMVGNQEVFCFFSSEKKPFLPLPERKKRGPTGPPFLIDAIEPAVTAARRSG